LPVGRFQELQRAHLEFAGRFTVSASVYGHFEGKLKVKPLSLVQRPINHTRRGSGESIPQCPISGETGYQRIILAYRVLRTR
jgi:hypothetical protein